MKLSEFENEKALDLLADILEPCAEICTDQTFVSMIRKGEKIKAVKQLLKHHHESVLTILALMDDVKPEEYHANIIKMSTSLLEILNDEEFMLVFRSQGQMISSVPFGSVTENTEEKEK